MKPAESGPVPIPKATIVSVLTISIATRARERANFAGIGPGQTWDRDSLAQRVATGTELEMIPGPGYQSPRVHGPGDASRLAAVLEQQQHGNAENPELIGQPACLIGIHLY